METVWRPSHQAQSTIGGLVSNPGGSRIDAVYTFGHRSDPLKTSEQDRAAVAWWELGTRASTNASANRDIEEFWKDAASSGGGGSGGDGAAAVSSLTGRELAASVKKAGRGSNITLGFLGNEFTRSSKYHDDFCNGGASGASKAGTMAATQYAATKQEARANHALGAGTSLSLEQPW